MENMQEQPNPAELQKEILAMPEFKLREKLYGFQSSIYILEGNFHDLYVAIQSVVENPEDAQTADYNHSAINDTRIEIGRRLHNFVAAAKSLIDHARRFYRNLYVETNNFPDYITKIQVTFINDPLSEFVKSLREYCVHYKSPVICIRQSFTREGDSFVARRTVYLNVNQTQTDFTWTPSAKKYIAENDREGIDILKVITEYRNKVFEFYEWFQGRQMEIHADELARLRDKEMRFLSTF
jgi:hypothetical protein